MAEQQAKFNPFPVHIELACLNADTIHWHILGVVDGELRVDTSVDTPGLSPTHTLGEAAVTVGHMLTLMVLRTYLTSEVPDHIEWTGHVHPGLCMN